MEYYHSEELYHHGIKGQRWGVRRYQNYDGTYTKRGLKRYTDAENAYNKAKQGGDKAKIRTTRRKMKSAYKQLKRDYRADKGKEAAKNGHTITSNAAKRIGVSLATAALEVVAYNVADNFVADPKTVTNIKRGAVAVAAASDIAYRVHSYTEDRNLRAYYNH